MSSKKCKIPSLPLVRASSWDNPHPLYNMIICRWHFAHNATGLKVNFNKSFLIPINVDESRTSDLVDSLGCNVSHVPFTYLGLPLGTTRLDVGSFSSHLDYNGTTSHEDQKTFSYAGRLILVNSVYSAMPTFYLCVMKVPLEIWE